MSGSCIGIRIEESTDGGVVVSGLEVVEPRFIIVVVAAVAERVNLCEGAGGGDDVAVGVLVVAGYGCAIGINELHYIALQVGDAVIQHIANLHRNGSAGLVIEEIQNLLRGCAAVNRGRNDLP